MSLKDRASGAVFWAFVDRAGESGTQALVSIVLARLLMPAEIGLVGMLWIFMALIQILVDGGFGQALLQKQNATKVDECSIFYFNLGVSLAGMVLLWFAAPLIAHFYSIPLLASLARVVGLNLPINALGLVHAILLSKRLDMKTQAKCAVVAAVTSGAVGITMAYFGFGVWSLVGQTLTASIVRSCSLWYVSSWRPALLFSMTSLKSMFPFGSRLLVSSSLDAIFRNLTTVVIGKFLSSRDVGYYSVATRIPSQLSDSLVTIVSRVTLSVYPTLRDDMVRYRQAFRQALKMMMIINTPLMVGIAAIADPMVRLVLTEKWLPSVTYMQLFCLIMMISPLHYGNLEALLGLGRSDLYMKLELLMKSLIVLNISISFRWGISGLLIGWFFVATTMFCIQSYYVGVCINHKLTDQVRDFLPSVLASFAMGGVVWLARMVPIGNPVVALAFDVIVGIASFIAFCWIFRIQAFHELLDLARRFQSRLMPGRQAQPASGA